MTTNTTPTTAADLYLPLDEDTQALGVAEAVFFDGDTLDAVAARTKRPKEEVAGLLLKFSLKAAHLAVTELGEALGVQGSAEPSPSA
ncbi:hypothetical protein [Methylobacterium nodulans]|uniref:Uncharacterized protein n=1 Tax=Methylobacterium nodulans (strain LMG 21967 / CNCM I-2342 / ORS 2060) TaxID=460265 RepID=B8IMQ5_METNO|nr:hypothetical protein [Methylobacterium nodulans]ACL60248.1 hypothetical protein Mnod_5404 [Methylobacterium nodulans ORS 2060]